MQTRFSTSSAELPRFQDTLTAVLWGARVYLRAIVNGKRPPHAFDALFWQVLSVDTQAALTALLDYLIYHSTVPLQIHDLECTVVSAHEQAIADGIRAIWRCSLTDYQAAMAPVLIDADALAIGPEMQAIADALLRIERSGFVQSACAPFPASLMGGAANDRRH